MVFRIHLTSGSDFLNTEFFSVVRLPGELSGDEVRKTPYFHESDILHILHGSGHTYVINVQHWAAPEAHPGIPAQIAAAYREARIALTELVLPTARAIPIYPILVRIDAVYRDSAVYVPTPEQRGELNRLLRFDEWTDAGGAAPIRHDSAFTVRQWGNTWYFSVTGNRAWIAYDSTGHDGKTLAYSAPAEIIADFIACLDTMTPLGQIDEDAAFWFDAFRGEPLPELLDGGGITYAGMAMYALQMFLRDNEYTLPCGETAGIPIETMQFYARRHFGRDIARWEGPFYLRAGGTAVGWHGYSYHSSRYLVPRTVEQRPDGSYDALFDMYALSDGDWTEAADHYWRAIREYLLTGNDDWLYPPRPLRLRFSLMFDDGGPYIVYHEAEFP
jgi:hypothetical protein